MNTTSPTDEPSAPMARPLKIDPSSSAKIAGVDNRTSLFIYRRTCRARPKKSEMGIRISLFFINSSLVSVLYTPPADKNEGVKSGARLYGIGMIVSSKPTGLLGTCADAKSFGTRHSKALALIAYWLTIAGCDYLAERVYDVFFRQACRGDRRRFRPR